VTHWTETTLLAAVRQPGGDAKRGQLAFEKALCSRCHRFQQLGGGAGPDLTGVRARFSDLDLIRSILTPSRDISDQYHWSIVTTEDDLAVGRILRRDPDSLVLNTDPFGYQPLTLSGKVISIEASPDSPMPNGLIDTLDEGQVRDLWLYLGNSSRPGSGNSHLRKNGQQGQ
jgi:putative heme-binding domain-containing protein